MPPDRAATEGPSLLPRRHLIAKSGMEFVPLAPVEMQRFSREEPEWFGRIAKAAGIQPE